MTQLLETTINNIGIILILSDSAIASLKNDQGQDQQKFLELVKGGWDIHKKSGKDALYPTGIFKLEEMTRQALMEPGDRDPHYDHLLAKKKAVVWRFIGG